MLLLVVINPFDRVAANLFSGSLIGDSISYYSNDGNVNQSTANDFTMWSGGNWNNTTPPTVVNDPATYSNNAGNKVIQTVYYFGLWDKGGSKTGVHCQLTKNKKDDGALLFKLGDKRTMDFSFYIPSNANPASINYKVLDPNDGITYSVVDNGSQRAIHQFIQNFTGVEWCPSIMFLANPGAKKLYLRNVTMPFVGVVSQLLSGDPTSEERDFELMSFNLDTWYTIRFQAVMGSNTAGLSRVYRIENGVVVPLIFKQVLRDHSAPIYEKVNGVSVPWMRDVLEGTTLFTEYFDIVSHTIKQVSNPNTYFSTETYTWYGSSIPAANKRAAVTCHDNIKIFEEKTYTTAVDKIRVVSDNFDYKLIRLNEGLVQFNILNHANKSEYQFCVYTIAGKMIYRKMSNQDDLDIQLPLPKGFYLMEMSSKTERFIKKIVI